MGFILAGIFGLGIMAGSIYGGIHLLRNKWINKKINFYYI